MKWAFIHNRLSLGDDIATAEDLLVLRRAGITHIINCRRAWTYEGLAEWQLFQMLFAPTEDNGEAKGPEWFADALRFSLDALSMPMSKVHVHCFHGQHRGPSMALAILLAQGLQWSTACLLLFNACRKAQLPEVAPIAYGHDAKRVVEELGYA
jgi:hypothetical protein